MSDARINLLQGVYEFPSEAGVRPGFRQIISTLPHDGYSYGFKDGPK